MSRCEHYLAAAVPSTRTVCGDWTNPVFRYDAARGADRVELLQLSLTRVAALCGLYHDSRGNLRYFQ